MSAFIVDTKVIDTLIQFAINRDMSFYLREGNNNTLVFNMRDEKDVNAIGQILVAENYRSVNCRYNETEKAPNYVFTPAKGSAFTPIAQILKYAQCLDYQSCESRDWDTTNAFRILTNIKDKILSDTIGKTPEYESAKWG
jgi:hypothetical protein